jgi:hypothetical protein
MSIDGQIPDGPSSAVYYYAPGAGINLQIGDEFLGFGMSALAEK